MDNAQNLGRNALYEEVAERLRQRIFARELMPGSWIDEMKISQEYGISRTPLREALKVLATEGLVTMKLRRGAYVTEVSDKDLKDVYHLLALLESDAAAQVAHLASSAELEDLLRLHEQLKQSVADRNQFFALNEQFHLRILALANNKWRTQMVLDLRKVMKLNRQNSLLKSGRVEESLNEHQALMDALQARNPLLSMEKMQAHFANGLEAASHESMHSMPTLQADLAA
ncbi:MAG: GntR family transcriptional regulator [Betaproteobacteria bacterium]|nr:GntR family transcriptional regulator [Betaproteobacteria bacterium]NBY05960.1 GntR family transcriptional regulator [Betaproteobacteria bacterium]